MYNRDGYDRAGYDRDGYNKDGYDWDGYDRDGYDWAGYNWDGYNRDGYNWAGYNRDGYNKDGCAVGFLGMFVYSPVLKSLPHTAPSMPRSPVYTGIRSKEGYDAALRIGHHGVTRDRPFDVPAWEARWNTTPEHRDWFWYYRKRALQQPDVQMKTTNFLFHPEIQTSDMPSHLIFVWEPL